MTRLNLAVAAAILLAGGSLLPLTEDRAYLVHLAIMLLASVGIGAAVRALRGAEYLARLLQLVPGVVAGWWLWDAWPGLIGDTAAYIAGAFAPMPAHDGFRVLTVAVLWLLFVVAEVLAGGLDRAGWTFPVLVLPYLIPALVLSEETSPVHLALPCAGYVLVLATAVYIRAVPELTGGRRRLAFGIGVTAAIVAVGTWILTAMAAAVIPERGAALLDPNRVDSSVQLGDPTLDLVRNLRSPAGRTIITYTSSDDQGHYLRLAALSAFDRSGFHLVPTELMPDPPGLPAGVDDEPVRLAIEIGDFGSEWLPVPWVPQDIEASGEWRHDPATGAIAAIGPNRTIATRDLDYQVESRLMQPGQPEIAGAEAGDPGDGGLTLALPEALDRDVIDLAQQVAGDAATAGERTLALARWLRSDEFTYSTAIVEGSTLETVNDFLLVSRTGYCEQFAGSLAILTRALGIPSRVIVGFLPGTPTADGYEVSTKDMHAWTEVFLDGLGWVALDPTPSGALGAAPVPSPSPTTAIPSAEPDDELDDVPTAAPGPADPAGGPGGGAFQLPGWTGWLVVGLLAALVPAGLRRLRTWRRLQPHSDPARAAEDAWDELRDTVLDLGQDWPEGTPRQVAAELTTRLDPDAAAALTQLALGVERVRFAPAETVDRPVDPQIVQQLTTALRVAAPNRQPLGRVFPRSVLRRR